MSWFKWRKNKNKENVEENVAEVVEEAAVTDAVEDAGDVADAAAEAVEDAADVAGVAAEAVEDAAEGANVIAAETAQMISVDDLKVAADRAAEEAEEMQTAAAELTEAAEAAAAENADVFTAEAAENAFEKEADEAEDAADMAIAESAEEAFEEEADGTEDSADAAIAEAAEEAPEEEADEAENSADAAIVEAVEEVPEEETDETDDETEEFAPISEPQKPEKKGFFRRLVEGLSKTRANIARSFSAVFSGSSIDDDFYEELEEIMITADMGVETTDRILDDLRDKVEEQRIKEPAQCRDILIESIKEQMEPKDGAFDFEDKKTVILVIGVNGVGKTTSIGKLAAMYKNRGKRVLLAAADTFRAAACEQLKEWANRAGVEIVSGQEGADPGAVVYDAIAAAKARNADMLICDTAGRLHNKKNLMDELGKINRIIGREYPEAHLETFVVVDGTTGQNALIQARQFGEIADVTGIILTKLDGTAKGGIAVAIESQLDIPVKFIGVGEKIDDLQKFDADSFVSALFEA